ncbi:MAG TPA: insulinase family protein [Candidatus Monoglobus merdigallinarum]|uniref:Insulinase family protein n=1 Tax=Candidatus Monoglobus merdigallinarum TaxID=2838698 RepID=A0A9D1PS30_9FIRM|nr:insulinase family protein [Candidatus Monoglobus merdigallinarum]
MTEHVKNGVDLRFISAEKFKTNVISVFFNIPLRRGSVTRAALLPSVMKRGTSEHRTMAEISRYLDELYSTTLHCGIRAKGDGEVIYFSAEYIRDEFTGEELTPRIVALLKEFIFSPLIENGGFSGEYLDGEKQNLKNAIEGLINDKREYVDFKCREAMFGGEGYGLFEAGDVNDLKEITPKSLYEFYKHIINDTKVDIFASGAFDETGADCIRKGLGGAFSERDAEYAKTNIAVPQDGGTKYITEEIPVTQSKLCIGVRCGVEPTSSEYYALMTGGCIFGGSPFSKLFLNVREKLSLAYYAVARTERFKSAMFISCGIETDKYEAALNEITAQFKKMQSGEIDDRELSNSKLYLINRFLSMKDGLRTMEDYYLSQSIMDNSGGIDDLIKRTEAVTKEEIVEVFKKLSLDTVYFLKGSTGGGAE